MNKSSCCTVTSSAACNTSIRAADGKAHPSPGGQRRFALAKFSLPALILALLPKCPACFAAYVALGTGMSVSVAAASLLRTLLIGVCVAMLILLLANTLRTLPMSRLLPGNRIH